MKVFWALMTMIGSSGRSFLMRGQEVEGVLVGHHHVGDDEIALPLRHPAPESRGVAGRADLVAGPRQGLVQDGPDGGIVVGEKDLSARHVLRSHKSAPRPSSGAVHGQENSESGSPGRRLAFDDAAVIAHDLRNRAQVRGRCPGPWWSRRGRRGRRIRSGGMPGPLSRDAQLDRQAHPLLGARAPGAARRCGRPSTG